MRAPIPADAATAAPRAVGKWGVRDLVALTKPGIVVSNSLVAAAGYALAGGAPGRELLAALAGTALLVASAGAWNMLLERDVDAQMPRTSGRPLASGRVSVGQAAWLASGAGAAGLALLVMLAPPLAAVWGLAGLVLYVLVYTPVKRLSPWSLVPGALSGAMPPLVGWSAAAGAPELGAWLLAAWLFAWQLPHFLALGVARRADYAAGGLRVLPVASGRRGVSLCMAGGAALLVPISAGLAWSVGSLAFGGLAVGCSAWFLAVTLKALRRGIEAGSGRVFRASIVAVLVLVVAAAAAWIESAVL